MDNPTIELLNRRSSLRSYADRPISDEHLDAIIHGAMRAPTAGNMMLYSILVIRDPDTRLTLSQTCDNQPFIASAPVVLVFLADMQRWYDYYEHCDVLAFCREKGIEYSTPAESDLLLSSADAIIAAQNAVVVAESLDIGSCYIGDIVEQYETHRELFSLPDWAFPVAMLTLGYHPDSNRPKPRPRFDRSCIVFDERYRRLDGNELDAMFADRQARMPVNNSYGAANAGQFMYARKTGADFSKEMARSVRVALKYWRGGT